VSRGAQLACYPAAASPLSDTVARATGGARYVPHRDGVAVGSGGVAFALVEPGFCMREVTAILYLSEPANWAGEGGGGCEGGMEGGPGREGGRDQPRVVEGGAEASRGGALLLHLGADSADLTGETASSVVEILPVGGRLVLFDSRTILHEAPARRPLPPMPLARIPAARTHRRADQLAPQRCGLIRARTSTAWR